jgi:3-methyladenine DNA glycosylase AlkD
MIKYVNDVITEFEKHRNRDNAIQMKAYLKNKFEFLGIKSPERRELSRPFWTKASLLNTNELWPAVRRFWEQPEREFQHFALELIAKYTKDVEKDWIRHYQYLITEKSWWDTVDYISATLVGNYFKKFPEQIPLITEQWMQSGNIWLQRACLIFQLKYKNETDTRLLSSFIKPLAESKEFFIAKAIGWALREYSKCNPGWVTNFVQKNTLQPLSKREAIRRIATT